MDFSITVDKVRRDRNLHLGQVLRSDQMNYAWLQTDVPHIDDSKFYISNITNFASNLVYSESKETSTDGNGVVVISYGERPFDFRPVDLRGINFT